MTKSSLLNAEQEEYVVDIARGKPCRVIVEMLNKKYGTDFTYDQIKSWKTKNHVKSGPIDECYKNPKITPEIERFIQKNYKGISQVEMIKLLKKEKNFIVSKITLGKYYRSHGLHSGLNGYFEKGHVPSNKNKKQSEYMTAEQIEQSKKTRFKKGEKPKNTVPIGYVATQIDGYKCIKVSDNENVSHNKNWKQLNRFMYEFYHGPISDDDLVIFANKNKEDYSKENLIIVNRKENAVMNTKRRYSKNSEITKTNVMLTKLEQKIKDVEKGDKTI